MGHWNHRVVRRKLEGQPDYYAIHEAYYGIEGEARVNITTDPVDVATSDDDPDKTAIESLRWTLQHMLSSLDKPVLDYDTREEM